MHVEVVDAGDLAQRGAQWVAGAAQAAIDERGTAGLAFSGGRTPAAMLRALGDLELPWDLVHVFQVDERVAPDGDPDRNLTELRDNLLSRVPIPDANVHPMPVTADDLSVAAHAYAEELAVVGSVLDLVHLGLGEDGHTASWPPGNQIIDLAKTDVAVVGPYRGRLRMTLTPPAVNRAREILWLVSGPGKAPMLERLQAGDPVIPASRVRRERATVLADVGREGREVR